MEERSSLYHQCCAGDSDGEISRSPDDVIKESLLSSDDSSEENLPSLVVSIRQLAESVDKLAGTIISKNSEEAGTGDGDGSNIEGEGGKGEARYLGESLRRATP